jgi:transcriptional regulator with XRE-family HTH domain
MRQALGLSQRDFCKGIYISQSYYAQIENENKGINDRIIALIAAKYRVNKDWLLTGTGEMFRESVPDMHLAQLLEIYHELDPLFKEYILLQIKQLLEVQKNVRSAARDAAEAATSVDAAPGPRGD